MNAVSNFCGWLFNELCQLVISTLKYAVLDWLLHQLQQVCEAVAARIGAYLQQAQQQGDDTERLQHQVVARIGEAVAHLGAQLIEHAETLTPEEALEMFNESLEAAVS